MKIDLNYFTTLRGMINKRLLDLSKKRMINHQDIQLQINKFKWLYGALGKVPSTVMFICENPSITGVERAHLNTIDGGPPDIEAQWWGGPKILPQVDLEKYYIN